MDLRMVDLRQHAAALFTDRCRRARAAAQHAAALNCRTQSVGSTYARCCRCWGSGYWTCSSSAC
eukprot:6180049-Pleurochrysis_carterae.AAC.1